MGCGRRPFKTLRLSLPAPGRNPDARVRKLSATQGVFVTGFVPDVRPYYEKAKEEFLFEGDPHGRALAEIGVAECCTRLGFTVRAMEQLETARRDLMNLKDNAGLGEIYRISGALMTGQANWGAAKSHLDKAVIILSADKIKPRSISGLVRTFAELGRMYLIKGDSDKSEAAFKDARDLAEKFGSKRLKDFVEQAHKDADKQSFKR